MTQVFTGGSLTPARSCMPRTCLCNPMTSSAFWSSSLASVSTLFVYNKQQRTAVVEFTMQHETHCTFLHQQSASWYMGTCQTGQHEVAGKLKCISATSLKLTGHARQPEQYHLPLVHVWHRPTDSLFYFHGTVISSPHSSVSCIFVHSVEGEAKVQYAGCGGAEEGDHEDTEQGVGQGS